MNGESKTNLFRQPVMLIWLLGIAASVVQDPCRAADPPDTNPPAISGIKTGIDSSQPLAALRSQVKEVDTAYEAYTKEAKDEQKEKLWEAYAQANDSLIPKILEAIRRAPRSPLAFELAEWVATNGRISAQPLRPYGLEAIQFLRDYHAAAPNIRRICGALAVNGDPLHKATMEFLQIASNNNPDRAARGYATFAFARLTKEKADALAFWRAAPSSLYTNAAAQKTKAEYLTAAGAGDSKSVLQQAEQLFETVVNQYGDCPNFPAGPGLREPKRTLGEQAAVELYECQHLSVGDIAPEIKAEDISGRRLRLSDYRGKVVVLSFWASWCGPCMQMVPHERAMSERLASKPFALVGVNGDGTKADAQSAVTKEKITWRSFWNGGAWDGSISSAWNVHGWPTVYVLDSKGIIRLKLQGYGGKRTDSLLDEMVDQLLKEVTRI